MRGSYFKMVILKIIQKLAGIQMRVFLSTLISVIIEYFSLYQSIVISSGRSKLFHSAALSAICLLAMFSTPIAIPIYHLKYSVHILEELQILYMQKIRSLRIGKNKFNWFYGFIKFNAVFFVRDLVFYNSIVGCIAPINQSVVPSLMN